MTSASCPQRYCGRFAPSPSGPLHLGSIVTALASYLEAKAAGGRWLVRIEDVDTQRAKPGAATAILHELERLGLQWDGPVAFQSQRREAYAAALARLHRAGHAYACDCSRREIGSRPYPGYCRDSALPLRRAQSRRLKVYSRTVVIRDRLQGDYCQALGLECGDFIVWRADDDAAYHLAVVVDDAWQGITDIVRGADLLASTPRQRHLQQVLSLPTPSYCHLPLVLGNDGRKLSKQTSDTAVSETDAPTVLAAALSFLGHPLPPELRGAAPAVILEWARSNWRLQQVPLASRAIHF